MQHLHDLFLRLLVPCLLFSSWVLAQTPLPPSTFPSASTVTSSNATISASQTNSADFPSLTGYSPCVTTCLALGSSAANCTSVVDVNCYCVSNRFTREILDCISTTCPSELTIAESLAQQFCNVPSNSTSLSFPSATTTATSTSTSTTMSTSTSSSSLSSSTMTVPSGPITATTSATTSNAASQGVFMRAGGTGPSMLYSIAVCVLGALLGAYLVE